MEKTLTRTQAECLMMFVEEQILEAEITLFQISEQMSKAQAHELDELYHSYKYWEGKYKAYKLVIGEAEILTRSK